MADRAILRRHAGKPRALRPSLHRAGKPTFQEAAALTRRRWPPIVDPHTVPGGQGPRAHDFDSRGFTVEGRDDRAAKAALARIDAGRAAGQAGQQDGQGEPGGSP